MKPDDGTGAMVRAHGGRDAPLGSASPPAPPAPGRGLRGRAGRAWLGLILAASFLAACGEPHSVPVIGTATSPGMQAAIVLGLEYASTRHPDLAFDTVFHLEPTGVAERALAVARALVDHPGVVAVLGHAGSSGTLLAAPLYREAGILQLAPTASAPSLEEAGPLVLRLVPSDRAQGRMLAQVVGEDAASGGGVAVLWVNDEYGRGLRDALLPALGEEAVPVLLDLPYSQTAGRLPDPEEVAELVEASGARVLVVLGRATVLDSLLPPLRRRVGSIPVYGPDGLGLGTGIDGREENPDWAGVRFLDFTEVTGTASLEDFALAWRSRTGRSDLPSAMLLARDAAVLVVEGIARGARDGQALAAWLQALPPDDPIQPHLLGGDVRFDTTGAAVRTYRLRQVGDAHPSPDEAEPPVR